MVLKRLCCLSFMASLALTAVDAQLLAAEAGFTSFVNPFCGTDAHGHTFPGATVPFGMVQLSPDTKLDTWDGCSGYHWSDSIILGFSHTHLSGTGCLDYGDILLMPVTEYATDSLDRTQYCSLFHHNNESASPGYYKVLLERSGINVELTAGKRFGMHRYTYPKGARRCVVIDLEHRDVMLESSLRQESQNAVSGFRRSRSWAENQQVYFWAEFSASVVAYRELGPNGALLDFGRGSKPVCVKVGISSVSVGNARENLHNEMAVSDFGFDKVRKRASDCWEAFLSGIDLRGSSQWKSGDIERLRTFYTSLYHCAVAPNLMSDANGQYRGMDGQIHTADGFNRYTVFSLWDTFRALHPLLSVIERERSVDFLKSFLSIYDECGKLPVWELWGHETNCMIGYNSAPVIADALSKGLLPDTELLRRLTDALVVSSSKAEYGLDVYREHGLVVGELEPESVSKTLEYAFDDWCVARCADAVFQRTGDSQYKSVAERYYKSSLYYRNIFDPETGFMRPRLNGRWQTPFEPREVNNHFTEANSWQYSFFVPHDVFSHIDMLGGDSAYAGRLDALFSADSRTKGRTQSDITGLIGQYAHGNEPSHHVAYLYNYAGQPWKTQYRVRQIMDSLYHSSPDGECGNDDCGQMAAWYVMSAMGLYSVAPGASFVDLGSPLFDNISVCGGKIVLTAETSEGKCADLDACPYISGLELNGSPWNSLCIPVEKFTEGFRFTYLMTCEPSSFGSDSRPYSKVDGVSLVRNPWFEAPGETFTDSVTVTVGSAAEDKVYYRTDGGQWAAYVTPLAVKESCLLEAYAQNSKGEKSFVTECRLNRKPIDKTIKLACTYNPQYDGGSYDALVDGIRGTEKWKAGKWQGFQSQDFEAVVDLLSEKEVHSVGAGFCQDARSWIWMPRYAEFYASEDGKNWTYLGRADNEVSPQDYTIQTRDLQLQLDSALSARYIKVFAKNYGTIPSWHLGAGGEAFIFIDEILIR